ncbi:MAG: hypothetical protein AB7G37_18835 [Solirubrobacteraceae bacterium]
MARKTPNKKQLRKQAKKAQASLAGREEAVRNLIENQDLHEDLRTLAEAARTAYARVAGAGPAALLQDKKVHSELRNASDALLDAKKSLKGKKKKEKKGRGLFGFLVLGLGGAVAAVVAVPSVRSKALDIVFGPEEELDYSVGSAAPAGSPNGSTQAAASAAPGATA